MKSMALTPNEAAMVQVVVPACTGGKPVRVVVEAKYQGKPYEEILGFLVTEEEHAKGWTHSFDVNGPYSRVQHVPRFRVKVRRATNRRAKVAGARVRARICYWSKPVGGSSWSDVRDLGDG